MKKRRLLRASACLLLSCAVAPLSAFWTSGWFQQDATRGGQEGEKFPAPKLQPTFCDYDYDVGDCKAMILSFFFNAVTGQCETFIYGGCKGNENRFESMEECQEACAADEKREMTFDHEKPSICYLPEAEGNGHNPERRYFYDHRARQCRPFIYSGWNGNANNFRTLRECQHVCERPNVLDNGYRDKRDLVPSDDLTDSPTEFDSYNDENRELAYDHEKPSICYLPDEEGNGRNPERRYFYNYRARQCRPFIYGGWNGNSNNFRTLEECQDVCERPNFLDNDDRDKRDLVPRDALKVSPTAFDKYNDEKRELTSDYGKPTICYLPEAEGNGSYPVKRYFYDHRVRRCYAFIYSGRNGNANNFRTFQECQEVCEMPDVLDNIHRIRRDLVPRDALTVSPTAFDRYNAPPGPFWCLSPADRGLCEANESRFFFDPDIGKCRTFNYSGCGGNENNFISEKSCLKACQNVFPVRMLYRKRSRKHPVQV